MSHRKQVRHYHEPGHLQEFTFSTDRRRPLLTNHEWQTRLALTLDEAGQLERFELVAFVFVPEHVHLLTYPLDEKPAFGRYLARVKQPLSAWVKAQLVENGSRLLHDLTVRERPGKTCFRFWQEGAGYYRNLFEPDAVQAAIDYIHENTVRRGLCRRAVDWKWSSARFYLSDSTGQQFPDRPLIHGPPPGSLE